LSIDEESPSCRTFVRTAVATVRTKEASPLQIEAKSEGGIEQIEIQEQLSHFERPLLLELMTCVATDAGFGRLMTFHTGCHGNVCHLVQADLLGNISVTLLASDAMGEVCFMAEGHEGRQLIDTNPRNG
jgi:hypothetical protein